jgi:hypothetical protein
MLITAVLCLCAAVVIAALGVWLLTRARSGDAIQLALRGVAPTQLAAAAMLAAGGTVALSSRPDTAAVVVVVCVVGAVSTVAAGCWRAPVAAHARRAHCPAAERLCALASFSCG